MQDIEEWLDEKLDEIVNTPGFFENPAHFGPEAQGLKLAAKEAGYENAALVAACGGNIARYIMNRQNAYTDAEIARKK